MQLSDSEQHGKRGVSGDTEIVIAELSHVSSHFFLGKQELGEVEDGYPHVLDELWPDDLLESYIYQNKNYSLL